MKKIILFAFCLNIVFTTFSQETINNNKTNTFTPNWYVGANGGWDLFFGEGNNLIKGLNNRPCYFNFKHNSGFLGRALVGYNFTPVIGVRGMFGYFNLNWPNASNADLNNFSSENLTADLIFNLSNTKNRYNPNRKLDFLVFTGVGMGYRNSIVKTDLSPLSGLIRAGIQTDYHLTNALDINIILDGNMTTDNYNDLAVGPLNFDLISSLSVGLSYHLGVESNKTPTSLITPLIPSISDEKPVVVIPEPEKPAEIIEPTTPVVAPEEKPIIVVPEVLPVVIPTDPDVISYSDGDKLNEHVFFTINQHQIESKTQKESMQRIADFIVAHPESKVVVSGYSDKATGTVAVNNRISKQRAVIVANTLIRQFNVPYKNIWVLWYGGGVQPYAKNNLNRLVIVHGAATFKEAKAIPALKTERTKTTPVTPTTVSTVVTSKETKTEVNNEATLFKVLHFNENSIEFKDKTALDDIKLIAEYLKRNSSSKATISGYADQSSDSEKKSTEISKNRAEGVANILMNDYQISSERIQVRWYGAQKETGTTPTMNKMVLISTVK